MATTPAPHAGERLTPPAAPGPGTAPADTADGRLPRHVAIIMDGNGRWAQRRGLPRIEGHRRGVTSVRTVTEQCVARGIGQLTLYCLSSENWRRPEAELAFLMHLLEQYLVEERALLMRQRIRLSVIGSRDGLPAATLAALDRTVEMCAGNDGMQLCLAINYGSRSEIVAAARDLARDAAAGLMPADAIDEAAFAARLDTAGMPDPDLLIRTAGEMRLSNCLLWQISYADLWVTPVTWPEFTAAHLDEALASFAERDRRYGGLSPS